MRRVFTILGTTLVALLLTAGPTLACGGLIGPNGAVNLLRTTTFAGYHDGVEHYVTSFEFAGAGGPFGSLIPLPGVPSDVVKGGDWTLQRLIKETTPPPPPGFFFAFGSAAATPDSAQVLMERKIDALDITVLKGGAIQVGQWAKDHGFTLPPDAPQVLDFYAKRSPIFLAAAFDPTRAANRDQQVGDGTPVHITIPTPNPWVPLRILALGKTAEDRVQADVFLLTDRQPTLLPTNKPGLSLAHDAPATTSLLDDLRSDRGMDWVPQAGWLSKIAINAKPADLAFDLAVDASGQGTPSRVAAGFDPPAVPAPPRPFDLARLMIGFSLVGLAVLTLIWLVSRRSAGPTLSR